MTFIEELSIWCLNQCINQADEGTLVTPRCAIASWTEETCGEKLFFICYTFSVEIDRRHFILIPHSW